MDFPSKAVFPILMVATAVTAALSATSARAQTEAPAQSVAQAEAQISDPHGDRNYLSIGLGAVYGPAYQGSDEYRTRALPTIDAAWGPLFANFRDGVGVKAIDTDFITAGVGVTFMQGRKAKYVPEGIGKLESGAAARGFVSLRARGFVATVGAKKGVSGDNKGIAADLGLSYPIRASARMMIVPMVGTTWTDKKYNNAYWGVDAAQSLASGLPRFRAGSGFTDASAMLAVNYRLTSHISLGASAGVTRTLGDVKDSPLVSEKTQPLGFAFLSYRF